MLSTGKKPSCFVSYCQKDINVESLSFLIQELRELSNYEINFFWDRDQLTGINLNNFMDELYICDAVILLLSPAYKDRIDNQIGGAYDEFQRIMGRLKELEELRRKQNKDIKEIIRLRKSEFSFFPYIYTGTGETACPEVLKEFKYENLSKWQVFKDSKGKSYVDKTVKKQYRQEFSRVISHIYANHLPKSPEYNSIFEEVFQKLFRTPKYEDAKGYLDEDPEIARHLFVKTHVYYELKEQHAFVLTGRKGTGKTTLTEYISKLQPTKYKEHFTINVDDFELESIAALISQPKILSEFTNIIRRERVFRIAWEIFIYIHCMEIIILEHQKRGLNSVQERALPHVENFINKTFNQDVRTTPLKKTGVFRWVLEKVINAIERNISEARNTNYSEFVFDLDSLTTKEHILETVLTKEVLYPFGNILLECHRRFLISVDGFDRNFDEFRRRAKQQGRNANELHQIVSFEIDWVRSLLYTCRVIRRDKDRWGLYNLIDFCITIPKERYLEIMQIEQDTVSYQGRALEIKWSGIELAIMLRKRLEILFQYYTDNLDDAINRLDKILKIGMEDFPIETITEIDDKTHNFHIFIDVLRHTFWKPRDILTYFASIISSYKYLIKRGIEFDWRIINKKISDNTFEVIEKEFLNEFRSAFPNIDNVIKEFTGKKQVITYNELESVLSKIDFEFATSIETITDTISKANFLFEIGFLGLRCPESIKKKFKLLIEDIFYFNDGTNLERIISDNTWKECLIVIHPIFCEYLNLDTSRQDITLKYNWDYLTRHEAMEFSSSSL